MTWQDMLRLSTLDVPLSEAMTEEARQAQNEGVIALAQLALSPPRVVAPEPAKPPSKRAEAVEAQIKALLKLGPKAKPSGVEGFLPQRPVDGDNVGRPPPQAAKPKRAPAPKKQGRGAAAPAGTHQAPQRQRGGAAALADAHEEDEDLAAQYLGGRHQADEEGQYSDADTGSDDEFGQRPDDVDHDAALDHAFRFGGIQGSTG